MKIELPNITGGTPAEQIAQIKSYLFQMVERLNYNAELGGQESNTDGLSIQMEGAAKNASQSDKAATLNEIKSLIIKSADIVEAFSEEIIKELDGKYVAQSDFGTYKEETNGKFTATSDNINAVFTKTEEVEKNLNPIKDSISVTDETTTIRKSNAWIKTGYLGDDADKPVYGVEVGEVVTKKDASGGEDKEVFNKYARFLPNGIEFYLASSERPAAYIKDQIMYILHIKTNTITMNGYVLDSSYGLAFLWNEN